MAPLKDLVANVDCFCEQEHERPCDNDRAFPKRPMESENTNPTGRRPFCGAIECRKLIRFAPAKSLIRQIDSLELLLRFLLKPDIIRESIGMPYFRLIMVCLSYLCNRRPRLNLENPTIAVVIAHRIHGSSFLFPAQLILWNCGSGSGEEPSGERSAPPDSDPFSEGEFGRNLAGLSSQFAGRRADNRFEFEKRGSTFRQRARRVIRHCHFAYFGAIL